MKTIRIENITELGNNAGDVLLVEDDLEERSRRGSAALFVNPMKGISPSLQKRHSKFEELKDI